MKKIMFIMTLAVALFLTACSQQEKATQTSSKQTSASSQTVTSASEEQKEGVSIDGSYRGQDEENMILLVVAGQKARLRCKILMEKKIPKRSVLIRSINPCVSGMSLIAIGSKGISYR